MERETTRQQTASGFLCMGTAEAMGQYYEVPVGDLFNKYEAWGIGAGVETMKKTAFGKALRNRGLTQKRGSHGSPRLWRGLRVTKGDKSSVFSPASTFTSLNTETLSPLVTRDEVGQEVLENGTDGWRKTPGVLRGYV